MVKLRRDTEWAQEGVRDCFREEDRKEQNTAKVAERRQHFWSLFIRCDMGEAKRKVRLDKTNKKAETWPQWLGERVQESENWGVLWRSLQPHMRHCRLFTMLTNLTLVTWRDWSVSCVSLNLRFTNHRTGSITCGPMSPTNQQRAHSFLIHSDYRLCSILRMINATFEENTEHWRLWPSRTAD